MLRRAALLSSALLTVAACSLVTPPGRPASPTAPMFDVLAERQAMHAKERSRVSLQEARDVPSLVEAAHAVLNDQGRPAPVIEVSQINQPVASGAAGPIGATLFRPALAKNTPIIIYFPGGTWATRRDVDDDELVRQLVSRTGFVAVALQPRLAPQATFPAIHDDALVAYQWARGQMRSWGADPTRVILAGVGPGANLALSTALAAREQHLPAPDGLLLITPWAGTSTSNQSMREYGSSEPLTRATFRWSQDLYAGSDLANPRIDLVHRSDLAGLPPTTIVLAEIDPTRSEAETLAARLQAAGVRTDVRSYAGVTYDFFGLGAYVPRAADAEADVAAALKASFGRESVPDPVSRSRGHR